MIPQAVISWLVDEGFGEIRNSYPVSGGCINNGAVLETESGQSFFLKTNSAAPKDMFAREAEGLKALKQNGGLSIPEVHLVGEDFLLLEDLKPSSPAKDYWH